MTARLTGVAAVLVLLAASCSSSGEGDATEPAAPTEQAVTAESPTATPTERPTAPPTPTATATPTPTPTEEPKCTHAPASDGDLQELAFDYGGQERYVRLTVPPSDGTEALPVVMVFHGFTSAAEHIARSTDYEALATERGYAVVVPDGTRADPEDPESIRLWHLAAADNPDVDMIVALLDHVSGLMCVDAARVYLSGLSNGAGISILALCAEPDRFAMAGVVSGLTLGRCLDGGKGVVAIHGTLDPSVPYGGGGEVPSVEEAMAELAFHGGCRDKPELDLLSDSVEERIWVECDDDAEFALYTVIGGGHGWPPSDLVSQYGEDVLRQAAVDAGLPEDTYINMIGPAIESIDGSVVILDAFDRHGDRVG